MLLILESVLHNANLQGLHNRHIHVRLQYIICQKLHNRLIYVQLRASLAAPQQFILNMMVLLVVNNTLFGVIQEDATENHQ